ncbi:hypothetical protein VNO78_12296 [Psophocarpus tetragonolobus]|uniref:Stomatal closure-related actin-binding protein coiled-coil domain-containing protein n=1 Tax=Psophocarpus tetragonolobus TaxID=3891 RepID=A0AAN9XPQ7_PSOTE
MKRYLLDCGFFQAVVDLSLDSGSLRCIYQCCEIFHNSVMHSPGSGYNQLSVCLSQPCVVLHSVVQNFLGFASLQHISDSYGIFHRSLWEFTGLWILARLSQACGDYHFAGLADRFPESANDIKAMAMVGSSFRCDLLASEDAKKLVNEVRAFAGFEIENTRAAVQRVEEALREHERMSRA